MENESVIFWYRRDLRVSDNVGLKAALDSGLKVVPIFIFDTNILDELDRDDARITFIYHQLQEIHKEFKIVGSGLRIFKGNPIEVIQKLTHELGPKAVYTNRDYEPYALSRDASIAALLVEQNISFLDFKDQVVFEKDEILKSDSKPYTVFTPYKRRWLDLYEKEGISVSSQLDFRSLMQFEVDLPSLSQLGFEESEIKVQKYSLQKLSDYAKVRDLPSEDSTSYLSPHLRFGTVSIREIIDQLGPKDEVFLTELIWREFFMQILYHFPHVVKENFRSKYNDIAWRNDEEEFERWCNGETGYPMVDAGMRQLNETGYMHNRVRMITAGFLCKHLLIDWRWGEAYFAKKLLDYELSANNGNWQWAAGTGCDAAPYFRIFNPSSQLEKFDPNKEYVQRWVREYGSPEYPGPMVEHSFARARALETYKEGIRTA